MNIVVIFGGASVEHDVSILTGLHAARNVGDGNRVRLVYLTRDNEMRMGGVHSAISNIENYIKAGKAGASGAKFGRRCAFDGRVLRPSGGGIRGLFSRISRGFYVDAVINCCHGGAGEDGRLAAYFDVLGVPVTSSGPIGAWNIQSKSRTRELLINAGFPQPKFQILDKNKTSHKIPPFPLIVKPDTLGSSIGITVAADEDELRDAVDLAFLLDSRVVVEEFIPDAVEINCAAFRYGGRVVTSACEVIKKGGAMLDFSKKYLDSASGFVKKGASTKEVHPREDEIKALAARAYDVLGAGGIVRADFLISNGGSGEIYLNECNSVPGFLSYHLWLKAGIPYKTLLNMVASQARREFDSRTPVQNFKSDVLEKNKSLVK